MSKLNKRLLEAIEVGAVYGATEGLEQVCQDGEWLVDDAGPMVVGIRVEDDYSDGVLVAELYMPAINEPVGLKITITAKVEELAKK